MTEKFSFDYSGAELTLRVIRDLKDPEEYGIRIMFTTHRWVGPGIGPDAWVPEERYRISADCSDLFVWACGDAEEITPENYAMLLATRDELLVIEREADNSSPDSMARMRYLSSLFAARARGMRPQGAAIPKSGKVRELFLAAGPDRAIDLGNPKSVDGEYQYVSPEKKED